MDDFSEMTVEALLEERAFWVKEIANATSWGAADAIEFRDEIDEELARRANGGN